MSLSKLGFLVVGAALAASIASCATDKTAVIRSLTDATCGVLPSVASVIAVTATGTPMAGAAADAVAKAICVAYSNHINRPKVQGLVSGCPEVDGVCVWADDVDLNKLKEYGGE